MIKKSVNLLLLSDKALKALVIHKFHNQCPERYRCLLLFLKETVDFVGV